MLWDPLPQREFRIGMTDDERENHVPGTGIDPRKPFLNLTRSLADDARYQPTRCLACGGGIRIRDGICSRCGEFHPGWKR